jgi:hypothetical protein
MLEHVQPGQPLRIPAPDWNAMTDAARADRARRASLSGRLPGERRTDSTVILVRNDSGADLLQYDVLGLGKGTADVLPTPDDNEDAFLNGSPFFLGALPDEDVHAGRFCIILGALPKGRIGPAAIAGVVPIYVNVQDADDWWADVDDGEHETLASGTSGTAQLLYKAAGGTGNMWCMARLGHCRSIPDGTADYQVPVWDNTLKRYYPGPCRAM